MDAAKGTAVTTDGDMPGPHFAGTLLHRPPFQAPGLVPVLDREDDDFDSDDDALIDRWDNCPDAPNPGWADSDGDGVGMPVSPDAAGAANPRLQRCGLFSAQELDCSHWEAETVREADLRDPGKPAAAPAEGW